MAVSVFKKKQLDELKNRAVELYKLGLSMRAVAKEVGKSHQWVAVVVRDRLSPPSPIHPFTNVDEGNTL